MAMRGGKRRREAERREGGRAMGRQRAGAGRPECPSPSAAQRPISLPMPTGGSRAGGRCAPPPSSAAGRWQSRRWQCLAGAGEAAQRGHTGREAPPAGWHAAAACARAAAAAAAAAPGMAEGAVSTVKMDGSGWSNDTALTACACGGQAGVQMGSGGVARTPATPSPARRSRAQRPCPRPRTRAEAVQVVLEGRVVAMPGYHVEGREGLRRCRHGGAGRQGLHG